MKKVFLLLAVIAVVFAGCVQDEISCYEEPEEISSKAEILEETETKTENIPEISDDEEPKEPESESSDDSEVSSGTGGTTGLEHIEMFIQSVERNEAASVSGTVMGYTFPYHFEISYEPGGTIKLLQVPPDGILEDFSCELYKIYDTETFYYFSGDDGNYFSVPKVKLYTDERFQHEPGTDIPDMPVTAKEAEQEAKNIMLFSSGNSNDFSYDKPACFGSYGHIILSGDTEKADEYYRNLTPKADGYAIFEGEYYYMVSMYEGEIDIGISYAVSAEKPFKIFSISMVDGSFYPLAYGVEPRVDLITE